MTSLGGADGETGDLDRRVREALAAANVTASGDVDAVIIESPLGAEVLTLAGADRPYRLMVEGMSEGALTLSASGRVLYANPRMANLLGVRGSDVVGSPVDAFLAPKDAESFKEMIHPACTSLGVMRLRVRRTDGASVPVTASVSRLDVDGETLTFLLVSDTTEEERANEAVRFQARLLNAVGEAIIASDRAGAITYLNDAAQQLFGCGQGELLGRHISDVAAVASTGREVATDATRLLRSGERWTGDLAVTRKGGTRVWLQMTGTPVFDSVGHPTGAIAVMRDVTDRRAAEEELARRERWFHALVANSSDLIAVVDSTAHVLYVNPEAERTFGYAAEDQVGRDAFDVVHPDDLEEITQLFFEGAQRPGHNVPAVFRLRTGSGEWRVLEAVSNNRLDDPAIGGIVVNARDVTESRAAAVALEQSEAMLRAAQRIAHLGHWRVDLVSGAVEWLSDQLFRIHGVDPECAPSTVEEYFALVHPDDHTDVRHAIDGALDGKRVFVDYRVVRPDGTVRYVRQRAEVVHDAQGRPSSLLGTAQDVTDAKLSELALRRSNASLRAMSVTAQAVLETTGEDALLIRVCRSIVEDGGYDGALIGTLDRSDPTSLHSVGYYARDDLPFHVARTDAGRQAIVRAAAEGTAVVADTAEAPRDSFGDLLREHGVRSLAAVPIRSGESCLGAVVVAARAPRVFTSDVVALLADLADQIAFAVTAYRTGAALAANEERYRAIVETAGEGICACDSAGIITYVNPRMTEILGVSADSAVGREMTEFVHENDRTLATNGLRGLAGSAIEIRFTPGSGETIHTIVAVQELGGSESGGAGSLLMATDITDRKRVEADLQRMALTDSLTGLANRALLLDRLEQALQRAARHGHHVGLLFIDLDHFKLVNDSLGHPAGDDLLQQVGSRLVEGMRDGDTTVARLGGDEFVLLCEGLRGAEDAGRVATRALEALTAPFELRSEPFHLTASIGIAIGPPGSAGGLLSNADAAMYRAKERGRNRFELFDAEMRTVAMERLLLDAALRRAIESGGIDVYYQPVVRIRDGAVVGFEALARWDHPERGPVSPVEFIPLAEESGLIKPLSDLVLARSCRQIASWNRTRPEGMPRLSMAVNFSGRQLNDPDLPQKLEELLLLTGVDPADLVIEITESVLMGDTKLVTKSLDRLHDLGTEIAVDDFGTGYSSLLYLRRFPVQILKLDRYFIAGVTHNPEDRAIVESVVSLAHALGMVALAEGVETPDQLAVLQELGCDLGQGWHWSKALPASALEDLIRLPAPAWSPTPEPVPLATHRRAPPVSPSRLPRRVVIIDDVATDRRLFADLLEDSGLFEVVGEAEDGGAGVRLVSDLLPDIVLLDISMPGVDGLAALPELLTVAPATRVVILSGFVSPALQRLATSEGATACLDKTVDAARLADALLQLDSPDGHEATA